MKRLLALLVLVLVVAAPSLSAQTRDSVVCLKCAPRTAKDSSAVTVWSYRTATTFVDSIVKVGVVIPPPVDTVKPPTTGGSILLTDDFERTNWYTKNCDQANASGGLTQEGGWCGTIYGPSAPARNVCGNAGYQSNCAATTGRWTGSDAWQADHDLSKPASDVYVRFFTKPMAGYKFGAEKILTFNAGKAGVGGIYHGNLHLNCGGSGGASTGQLQWQAVDGRNCGAILTMVPDHWYYIEVHLTVGAIGAGRIEVWANDCGTGQGNCTGTPTLRLTMTGLTFYSQKNDGSRGPPANAAMGSLWVQAYSNPESTGQRLIDGVKVSTGFNGFGK